MKRGVRDIHENSDPHVKRLYKDESIKLFDFFNDEFFGIEKTLSQIVRYFHAASLKGEESRQVLYLMGPVGSGKSSLVEKLHRGLEESEPFYAIEGCPMKLLDRKSTRLNSSHQIISYAVFCLKKKKKKYKYTMIYMTPYVS